MGDSSLGLRTLGVLVLVLSKGLTGRSKKALEAVTISVRSSSKTSCWQASRRRRSWGMGGKMLWRQSWKTALPKASLNWSLR